MTKKFDKIVAEIIEEEHFPTHNMVKAEFKDLPQRRPYGFWVYPDAKHMAIVMGPMEHPITAKQIIYGSDALNKEFVELQKFEGYAEPTGFIETKGYARVVRDLTKHCFHLDLKQIPISKRNKYIKFMTDVASMYRWGVETNV